MITPDVILFQTERKDMRINTVYLSWLLLLVATALLFSSKPMNAQSAIQICGTSLKIGMAKDSVIKAATAKCEIKPFGGEGTDHWCARTIEKANSGIAAYAGCDMLDFDRGILVSVSREYADVPDNAGADIINRVYEFIQRAKNAGGTVDVSLAPPETEFAGLRFRTISFSIRNVSVELGITQPVGPSGAKSSIRLTESIGPPAAPARKQ
jgi:hypothetical protein